MDGSVTVRRMPRIITELENSIKKKAIGLRTQTVKAIPAE